MKRMAAAALCALALLLVGLACSRGEGGGAASPGIPSGIAPGIEGSVEYAGAPVAGVFVEAFTAPPDGVAAAAASANSDSAGRFSLPLPRGQYWLTAKKKPLGSTGAGMLFGATREPVKVDGGALILEPLVLLDSSGEGAGGAGTPVTGRVTASGKPRAGALVYLYPGGHKRGPAFAAKTRSGADGGFRLFAPPGSYHLVARLRVDGESMGSLAAGDMVAEGATLRVGSEALAVGDIALHQVDGALLAGREWAAGEEGVTLSGRVTDEQGKPVAGVYAFLYPDHRMVGKPSALSAPTGKDGRYRLTAPGPGSWHLGARSRYGGPVEPGEVMGVYEVDGQRTSIVVGPRGAPGTLPASADIVVKEVW